MPSNIVKIHAKLTQYLQQFDFIMRDIPENIKIGNNIYSKHTILECLTEAEEQLFNGGDIHNEIVALNPRIKGLIAKVDNLDECPREFLRFARDNNLPIIIMKPIHE